MAIFPIFILPITSFPNIYKLAKSTFNKGTDQQNLFKAPLNQSHYIKFSWLRIPKNLMENKEFNNHGLDILGINWMQYLSMTLIA